ncbi:ArsR/SmtB family transcription factor [Plantibacter sp. CFBP 8775]|uniref:ArsR/SmtB family transcription factor n=1 Tax=Plantibacter sp. CFBP 8775 TaxID=2774038 RepID=UPI00177BFF71|nr:helix-turn-helix domain-containing protein [Plantibacter sp. CFBP 8775]MBD8104748.1 helix-turn-helix transcriptional regulator [Plantibacter sp. CFBP 8775]
MTEADSDILDLFAIRTARIRILQLALTRDEVTAAELMDELELTRNGVGRNLGALTRAGLLIERRATHPRGTGNIIYWRADPDAITAATNELAAAILRPTLD